MNNAKKISALANAKINLFLDVLNKRDDSYHNISSVFQSVSLADKITVELQSGDSVNVSTSGAIIEGENLVTKAADLFLTAIGQKAKVIITLAKSIPLSAGIGGGSADAAGVLVCLNKLFSNPLSTTELLDIGLKLGADVPFCISGGTALVEGIGEKLTHMDYIGDFDVILIKHHKKASTGQMYNKIDLQCVLPTNCDCEFLKLVESKAFEGSPILSHNSFLDVSEDKFEQEQICNQFIQNGAVLAGLSGSGPTVFGMFKNLDESFIKDLKKRYKEVYICKTAPQGIKIIE